MSDFKSNESDDYASHENGSLKKKENMHANVASSQGFSNFGALGELLDIINSHMEFMTQQEAHVDEYVNNSGSADLLRAAKETALETEKELMQQIMNISEINTFLNNIILIENLFNSFYTSDIKQKQENARNKYASDIATYEAKPKPTSEIGSFVELMFAGTNLHIKSFKKWLQKLDDACKENNVTVLEHSGAKGKNIERAFYKSFYVYAVTYGNDGFQQMTDVLRCSLVFNDFNDLYHCFALIEQLAAEDDNGGILRCKDRFNPTKMPFGYRDLLINIYSPGSKVVAEIQLHHTLFYKRKQISHTMYKKARLFEDSGENKAYKYANEHIRKVIGDKIYEESKDDNDKDNDVKEQQEEEEESSDDEEDNIFAEHLCEMSAEQLFEKWKLTKYTESFLNDEGYDEPNLWKDITLDELKSDYGFKAGHAKKFIAYVKELENLRPKFDEIKKKRAKIKKEKKKAAKQAEKNNEIMEEVEIPQKGKNSSNMKQQQGNTGIPLAKPQPLQNNKMQRETSDPVNEQPQPQQYVAPTQPNMVAVHSQPQPQPQPTYSVNQRNQRNSGTLNNLQPQYALTQQHSHNQLPQQYAAPQQQQYAAPQYAAPPQHQPPPPQQLQNQNVLPAGWSVLVTNDGKPYYLNNMTKETQWERPIAVNTQQPQYVAPPQQQYVQQQQPPPQQQYAPPQNQIPQNHIQQQPQQQYVSPQQQQQQYAPPQQQYISSPTAQNSLNAQNSQNQIPQQQQYAPSQAQQQYVPPTQQQQQQYASTQQPYVSTQAQQTQQQPYVSQNSLPRGINLNTQNSQPPIQSQQQQQYAATQQPQSQQSQQSQAYVSSQSPHNAPLNRQNSPPQTQQQQQYGHVNSQNSQNDIQAQSSHTLNPQNSANQYALNTQTSQNQLQQKVSQYNIANASPQQYAPQTQQNNQNNQNNQNQSMSMGMGGMGVMSGMGGGMGMGGVMNPVNEMQNMMSGMNNMNNMNNMNTINNLNVNDTSNAFDNSADESADNFHTGLAQQITAEDDDDFEGAFNSLYGDKASKASR